MLIVILLIHLISSFLHLSCFKIIVNIIIPVSLAENPNPLFSLSPFWSSNSIISFFGGGEGPLPRHMEVPSLGVKLELQLLAGSEPRICELCYSSWQRQTLKPLSEARDQTSILTVTSQIHFHWTTMGTPNSCFLYPAINPIIFLPISLTLVKFLMTDTILSLQAAAGGKEATTGNHSGTTSALLTVQTHVHLLMERPHPLSPHLHCFPHTTAGYYHHP